MNGKGVRNAFALSVMLIIDFDWEASAAIWYHFVAVLFLSMRYLKDVRLPTCLPYNYEQNSPWVL